MFNNVINQYRDVVNAVRQHVPNAVLVGGALRDTVYGKEVEDLDFVVGTNNGVFAVTPITPWLREVWPDKQFQFIPIPEFQAEYGANLFDDNPAGVMDVIESTDKTINMIIVHDITRYTHQFPDSISQMVFDGEQVHTSRLWNSAVMMNRVYYKEDIKPARLEKLRRKYPDTLFMVEMAPNVFRQQEFPQPINLEELNF